MRLRISPRYLVVALSLLALALVFQSTSAKFNSLNAGPPVPQAVEDIAGTYGGTATGSSADCDFLNPISEPVEVVLNQPSGSTVK